MSPSGGTSLIVKILNRFLYKRRVNKQTNKFLKVRVNKQTKFLNHFYLNEVRINKQG